MYFTCLVVALYIYACNKLSPYPSFCCLSNIYAKPMGLEYPQIFCSLSGEERLVSVEERETCDYVLHVETPLLCRQRLFRVTSLKKPQSLSCSPLVSQEEFQEYTEKQGLYTVMICSNCRTSTGVHRRMVKCTPTKVLQLCCWLKTPLIIGMPYDHPYPSIVASNLAKKLSNR